MHFDLSLGKNARSGKVTEDTFTGGIKREQIKNKEMLSIFSAIDNGDGILDKNEAAKLKKMLIEAARDNNLSESEAQEFLQKMI